MSYISRLFGLSFAVVLLLAHAIAATAEAPTTDFAKRIFAVTGAVPVNLTVRNATSLDADQVQVIRTGLETQIRSLGVKLVDAGIPATQLRITISQNTRGWVWIAEITNGSVQKIVMLSVPGSGLAPVSKHGAMFLGKQLLFTSDEPILDVLHVNTPSVKMLVAVSPSNVYVFQPVGSGWMQQQTVPIVRNAIMPRDPRGHIVAGADHLFDIYLPGTVCSSGTGLPLAISCRDADDLWPLGTQNAFFNASRNYFTGLLRPGFAGQLSPFYTAAAIPIADRMMWIFAGVDGQVRWTDGGTEQPLAGTADWGSDIAAIRSGCAAGTQVLASARSNDSDEDSIRAFEVLNQQASPVSTPLPFSGEITSMWTQATDGSVTAVARTTKGSYEAYAIDLSCN